MPDQSQSQQQSNPIADQFSDEDMEQIKRFGQALGGKPTPFDEEVEYHIQRHERNYQKMRAAQSGGSGLGPSAAERQQAQQTEAMQQQATAQGAQQAQQAQAQQAPISAPPAPSGPQGVTQPYPAQAGPQPKPEAPPAQPPAAPAPQQEGEGQEEAQ